MTPLSLSCRRRTARCGLRPRKWPAPTRAVTRATTELSADDWTVHPGSQATLAPSDPGWKLSYGSNHLDISVTSESGQVCSVVIYPYTFIPICRANSETTPALGDRAVLRHGDADGSGALLRRPGRSVPVAQPGLEVNVLFAFPGPGSTAQAQQLANNLTVEIALLYNQFGDGVVLLNECACHPLSPQWSPVEAWSSAWSRCLGTIITTSQGWQWCLCSSCGVLVLCIPGDRSLPLSPLRSVQMPQIIIIFKILL